MESKQDMLLLYECVLFYFKYVRIALIWSCLILLYFAYHSLRDLNQHSRDETALDLVSVYLLICI